MKILEINTLAIPEIKTIKFARFADDRGYFTETFRFAELTDNPEIEFLRGIKFEQVNESRSKAGVIRGLHFQWNPFMGKLVRTIHGRMFDLFMDIRPGSPRFGQICYHDMPARDNDSFGEWIWIPPGFAHGNVYIEDSRIEYFCSGSYSPGCERGISPLSADIDFSLCGENAEMLSAHFNARHAVYSDKDRNGLSLADWLKDPASELFKYGNPLV